MRRAVRLFPFAAFVLAACGGQSCSCLAPIPGGFPVAERHDNALQLRVTQGGLDFLQQNGKALVSGLLPGGQSTIDIPPSGCGGDNEVCCGNPAPKCQLDVLVQKVGLTPAPPQKLRFSVTTQLITKDRLPVSFKILIGKARCFVSVDTTKSKTNFKDVDLTSDVTFRVDPVTRLTNISLENTNLDHLDKSMIELASQPGDFLCTVVNFDLIKGFVVDQLKAELAKQIAQQADGAFCAKCQTKADCSAFADGCKGGVCTRGDKCLQEIGAVGRLDVGAMFAALSPSTRAGLDTMAVLGGYAETLPPPSGGLSLGLLGGGRGGPHSSCVPARAKPVVPAVGRWAAATGAVEPRGMKPYHLGFGIHESHLSQLAWGAFDGGALCLRVGTPQFAQLDSSILAVAIPSLADLVVGRGPAFIALRPQQAPRITLGAGTFNPDRSIKEPLLRVAVPELAVDFYVLVDERYVRAMTLTADVSLPLSLDVDAKGQIVPLLPADLKSAFTNLRVTNSELLAESPKDLAAVFPTLLGVAAGQIGGALQPIAIPKLMGLDLKVVAIEPTDGQKFLSLFANLGVGSPEAFQAETTAAIDRLRLPETAAFSVSAGLLEEKAPRLELSLSGRGLDGGDGELEWQLSFDDGATWSPWTRERRLTAGHALLWLQGRHHLLVRARVEGDPATTDPTPVRLDFLVDTVAPTGAWELEGDALILDGEDAVSPGEALEFRVDRDGRAGSWSRQRRQKAEPGDRRWQPVVLVRDEAGNVGPLAFHGRTTDPAPQGGCGCALGGARPIRRAPLLLALLPLALLVRRRRGTALTLGAALLAAAVAGCGQDAPPAPKLEKGDLLDPQDQVGRHSDAATRTGVLHLSAYDDRYGDLAYTRFELAKLGDTKALEWQWVDGIPADAPVENPGSYRQGRGEPGDDVGLYSSIAVDGAGEPRIAYYDATNKRLKFARAKERRFTTMVVDAPPLGRAGLYASLSLDPQGVPAIAYVATELPDGAGGFVSRLRLATAKGPEPSTAADWTIVDLDETYVPCAGLCSGGQACVWLDPKDLTRKSQCKAVDAKCPKACAKTEACVAAACVAVVEASKAPELVEGVGLFAQLRRLRSGKRVVVYYDRVQGDLKLATESAPGMFGKRIVDGMSGQKDVGQFASAQVGDDDTLHVAYLDAIADRLLYRAVKGEAMEAVELVDDGTRMDGPRPVGAGASLLVDGDEVRVVYQEQAGVDLWSALRSGGAWSRQPLRADAAGHGFYPHLIADGGKQYLTEFVYDRARPSMGASLGSLQVSGL